MDDEKRKALKWKTHSAKVAKQGGEDSRKFTFTFSSGEVDRDNDVIDQLGIDLQPFKSNPVVLWAHDYRTPPVARVTDTWFREGKLMGSVEFPPKGVSPMSDTLHGLVQEGFINATSIGFSPKEWTFDEERGGVNFKSVELFEVSLVPVPSNRAALLEAQEKGIDMAPVVKWAESVRTWAEEAEKGEGKDTEQVKDAELDLEAVFKEPDEPDEGLADEIAEVVKTAELVTIPDANASELKEEIAALRSIVDELVKTKEAPAPEEEPDEPAPPTEKKRVARPITKADIALLKGVIKAAVREPINREVQRHVRKQLQEHTGRLDD